MYTLDVAVDRLPMQILSCKLSKAANTKTLKHFFIEIGKKLAVIFDAGGQVKGNSLFF